MRVEHNASASGGPPLTQENQPGAAPIYKERRSHPEATPAEIHIGNIYACDFSLIGWKTKRLGKVPIGADGNRLVGGNMRPVFVDRAEIEAADVPIPATGPVDHRW